MPTLPSPQDSARVQLVDLIDPVEVPWISDPSLALKPRAEWPATVPSARVMVAKNEWEHAVSMLYARSLVAPIPDSDVFQVDGHMVLNGMFGVEKPDKPPTSRGPALRLITNFVPINSYIREVLGEVHTLPRAGQWATVVLADGQVLVSYSKDQSASFYLYSLPVQWCPYIQDLALVVLILPPLILPCQWASFFASPLGGSGNILTTSSCQVQERFCS